MASLLANRTSVEAASAAAGDRLGRAVTVVEESAAMGGRDGTGSTRAGQSVDEAHADESDLLVGIMLSHPGRSEPRQLLAHVGASAADVLPADYLVPGKDLERYGAEIPVTNPPS